MFDNSGNYFYIESLPWVKEFLLFVWLAIVVHHLIIVVATCYVCVSRSHCMIHLMVLVDRHFLLRVDLMVDDTEKFVSHFQEHRDRSLLQVKV